MARFTDLPNEIQQMILLDAISKTDERKPSGDKWQEARCTLEDHEHQISARNVYNLGVAVICANLDYIVDSHCETLLRAQLRYLNTKADFFNTDDLVSNGLSERCKHEY